VLALAALVCFLADPARAAEPEAGVGATSEAETTEDDDRTGIMGAPHLGYSPETGLLGGVGSMGWFHIGEARVSSVRAAAKYSERHQWQLKLEPDIWWGDHHVHARLLMEYFPTYYWGTGSDAPDDARESYAPRSGSADVSYEQRIWRSLYAGGRVDLRHHHMRDIERGGLIDAGETGEAGGWMVGVGPQITWDNRDSHRCAYEGFFFQGSLTRFEPGLGSDYGFERYFVDGRAYFMTGLPGQVVAVQGVGEFTRGAVPFYARPRLGGKDLLRGYYQGRYTDAHLLATQAELRQHVWRWFGLTAFGGVGTVAPSLGAFGDAIPRAAGGAGLRFAISQKNRLNARIDVGFSPDETALYVSFGEAF
jgi:outer membrane protein assembly factor BamA